MHAITVGTHDRPLFNPLRHISGPSGWSFPSGHVAAVFAVMAVLWWSYARLRPIYVACVAAVAVGLIGANYHFLSDILGAIFVGLSASYVTTKIPFSKMRLCGGGSADSHIPSRARDRPGLHPIRSSYTVGLRGTQTPRQTDFRPSSAQHSFSRRLRIDGQLESISSQHLYDRLGTASAPILMDVRRQDAFGNDDRLIIGALYRPPDEVERWRKEFSAGRPIVAYCAHGREVSQGVAEALRRAGVEAVYLEGGIGGWKELRLPTRRKRGASENKWVTREHPKIDLIACPWLISRFIKPDAEFIYVPPNEVTNIAASVGGTPYDIKGVEFGHVSDLCSFDAIVNFYDIHDAALDHLATIVRGADTSRPDLTPQCEGLLAISYGLSANFPNDHEMLKHGMIMYDALYTWCRQQVPRESLKLTA
jgi:rhodanese-related sulfurtransferase